MATRVISGVSVREDQPMPWQTVGGTVAAGGQTLQYSMPNESNYQMSDTSAQLAQLRAKMATAETEKDRMVIEAQQRCRREGEIAGRAAADAKVGPVLERLAASIQQVSELPAQMRAQAEADLVRLAVAIAQRILQRELNVDPAVITALVRVGLEKVQLQDMMRVRVCAEHLAAIKECLAHSGAAHVEVSADPTLERGGMIFETSRGALDVSIGTQLREIERGLTDRLRGQS